MTDNDLEAQRSTVAELHHNGKDIPDAQSSLQLDETGQAELLATCEIQMQHALESLDLQCTFCEFGERRARPWCQPRGPRPRLAAFARR